MKKYFTFIFKDYYKQFYILFGILQLSLCIILLTFIFDLSISAKNTFSSIDNFKAQGSINYLFFNAESNQVSSVFNDKNKEQLFIDGCKKYLYPCEKVTVNSSTPLNFQNNNSFHGIERNNQIITDTVRVSSNFFDFYNVKMNFANNYSIEDFRYDTSEEIPIVLGNSYTNDYQLGNIIKDVDGFSYKIIGFTDKDMFYYAPFQNSKAINLNETIIMPIKENDHGFNIFLNTVGTYFFSSSNQQLDQFIDYLNKNDLLSAYNTNVSEGIKNSINNLYNEIETMIIVLLILLIFAFIGIVTFITRLIQKRIREFAIHIMYGATTTDIIIRFSILIVIMTIISLIPSAVIFNLSLPFYLSALASIIIAVSLLIYPILMFKKQPIISIVRSFSE